LLIAASLFQPDSRLKTVAAIAPSPAFVARVAPGSPEDLASFDWKACWFLMAMSPGIQTTATFHTLFIKENLR
jgi:hypothetical protein